MLTCRSTAENSSKKIQPVLLCTRSCVKFSPTGAVGAKLFGSFAAVRVVLYPKWMVLQLDSAEDPRAKVLHPERYAEDGLWKDLRGIRWSGQELVSTRSVVRVGGAGQLGTAEPEQTKLEE
jgi:hypothetical protein